MGSCKYFFILFAVTFLSWFDPTYASPTDDSENENDRKYIAYDESLNILKDIQRFTGLVFLKEDSESEDNTERTSVFGMLSDWFSEKANNLPSIEEFVEPPEKAVILKFHNPEKPEGIEFSISDLDKLPFQTSLPTKIICHGWMSSTDTEVMRSLTDAYISHGKYNVIAVDWSVYSKDFIYPLPAKSTKKVGDYVGDVINALVEKHNARFSDFHIIGHSLGAHVAGFAGSNTKEKIGRITGLDPALPGFQYVQGRDGRLDDTDAAFVDVIHTCSGLLGMSVPVGHADFYPNGGTPFQPGCMSVMLTETKSCSHGRSFKYFIESLENSTRFVAVSCKDWSAFKNNHCENIYTEMGEYVSRDTRGIFYLITNTQHPFALGEFGVY